MTDEDFVQPHLKYGAPNKKAKIEHWWISPSSKIDGDYRAYVRRAVFWYILTCNAFILRKFFMLFTWHIGGIAYVQISPPAWKQADANALAKALERALKRYRTDRARWEKEADALSKPSENS